MSCAVEQVPHLVAAYRRFTKSSYPNRLSTPTLFSPTITFASGSGARARAPDPRRYFTLTAPALTAAEGSVVVPRTRPRVGVPPAGVATLTVNGTPVVIADPSPRSMEQVPENVVAVSPFEPELAFPSTTILRVAAESVA